MDGRARLGPLRPDCWLDCMEVHMVVDSLNPPTPAEKSQGLLGIGEGSYLLNVGLILKRQNKQQTCLTTGL